METTTEKSVQELLSCAEKYASLYMLIYVDSLDAKYGDRRIYKSRLNDIFTQLELCYAHETDLTERARIVCGLFHIIRETIAVIDREKYLHCHQLCYQVIKDSLARSLSTIPVMKCIADYLYTCSDDEDEQFHKFFISQLETWVKELDDNGCWKGISSDEAKARLELMDMNSYMLMDDSFILILRKCSSYIE